MRESVTLNPADATDYILQRNVKKSSNDTETQLSVIIRASVIPVKII